MAKHTTLKDLTAFLEETGDKKSAKIKTAEDFINSEPNSIGKTKKLKIGNGMDKDTLLGPLCTKQRLEGVEKLVETTKKLCF